MTWANEADGVDFTGEHWELSPAGDETLTMAPSRMDSDPADRREYALRFDVSVTEGNWRDACAVVYAADEARRRVRYGSPYRKEDRARDDARSAERSAWAVKCAATTAFIDHKTTRGLERERGGAPVLGTWFYDQGLNAA